MAKLSTAELEALRLSFAGKSDIQAYHLTHPKASKKSCTKNAWLFFRRARAKLSVSEELEMRNLSRSRVFIELEKRLNAMQPELFAGKVVHEHEDNFTRMAATKLLAKINGLLDIKTTPEETDTEDTELRIVIDDDPKQ